MCGCVYTLNCGLGTDEANCTCLASEFLQSQKQISTVVYSDYNYNIIVIITYNPSDIIIIITIVIIICLGKTRPHVCQGIIVTPGMLGKYA